MSWSNKARATTTGEYEAPVVVVSNPTDSDRVWSKQQESIFEWFEGGKGNLIVRARAGTGKTTTIIEGVRRMPEDSVILAAFNKRIAEELTVRLGDSAAEAKTLHSIGFSLVREFWPGVRTARGDDRAHALTDVICGKTLPFTIKKLVSKLHTKGREITPYALTGEDLIGVAEQFECEPEDFWRHQGFDLKYICEHAAQCMALAADEKPKSGIDFADMIFLPLVNKWAMPRYDAGVIDEAQDMTRAQLDLARKVIKPGGRMAVVGDDRQAIYGFRGADSESLDRLKKELKATEKGLTTSYRCGHVIGEHVQTLVPDFETGPNNPQGTISHIDADVLVDAAMPGDFILSRLNAPLAGYAMQLLREGKRAKIAGRDVGNGLKALVRKLSKNAKTVDTFLDVVDEWCKKEVKRLLILKFEARAALVEDQAETLYHLSSGAKSIADIDHVIDRLFSDDVEDPSYVLLSSVHKAKGLEASKVFVLDWTFRRGKAMEEDNIYYVAVTRAKDHLVFVEQTK